MRKEIKPENWIQPKGEMADLYYTLIDRFVNENEADVRDARKLFNRFREIVVREREKSNELAFALLSMYSQYCDMGHSFMSAGEEASGVLEEHGYAKFDNGGRILKQS